MGLGKSGMAENNKINKERTLRRMAVQIAGELPMEPGDALTVLAYARELVEDFIQRPVEEGAKRAHLSVVKAFPNEG